MRGEKVMSNYTVRTMRRDEIDWAVEQAAKEGWNPGLHDAGAFYAQDKDGFIIGELDGQPVGCVSAVSYEGEFGFIGFYIVVPEFRGKGYGLPLWDASIKKLEGHVSGLDGVIEQQDNYKKSGFEWMYSNIRFEYTNSLSGNISDEGIVDAVQIPFNEISAYDRSFFCFPRENFLKAWLGLPDAHKLASVNGSRLDGYGVIRKCRAGYKIGPLFAENADTAEKLFAALCLKADEGEKIYLDVPEVNPEGMALAGKYGMEQVFGTARMYKEGTPKLPVEKIFGVTTFELG